MDSNETITCMFTRFTDIVNGLKSLGKNYTNSELVRKILRCLPRSWKAKVMAIQEAKDLNKLPLEELLGSLMTHELTMKQHNEEESSHKKKVIALKSTSSNKDLSCSSSSEEEEHEEDDGEALLVRKFRKFINHKKSYHQRRGPSNSYRKDKGKERENEGIGCYECKKPGHIRAECPLLKKGSKYKKKKALVTTLSDSDSSSSSSDEEQEEKANFCFMANENEVTSESPLDFTFDELYDAFNELMIEYKAINAKNKELKVTNQTYIRKYDSLVKDKDVLIKENLELKTSNQLLTQKTNTLSKDIEKLTKEISELKNNKQILNENVIKDLNILKTEKQTLTKELEKYKPLVEKFTYSSEKLNMILNSQRAVFNRAGLGYKPKNKQKLLSNFFVKAGESKTKKITCFCCGTLGHKANVCDYRKGKTKRKIKRIWISKGTNTTNHEGSKKTWVPKTI